MDDEGAEPGGGLGGAAGGGDRGADAAAEHRGRGGGPSEDLGDDFGPGPGLQGGQLLLERRAPEEQVRDLLPVVQLEARKGDLLVHPVPAEDEQAAEEEGGEEGGGGVEALPVDPGLPHRPLSRPELSWPAQTGQERAPFPDPGELLQQGPEAEGAEGLQRHPEHPAECRAGEERTRLPHAPQQPLQHAQGALLQPHQEDGGLPPDGAPERQPPLPRPLPRGAPAPAQRRPPVQAPLHAHRLDLYRHSGRLVPPLEPQQAADTAEVHPPVRNRRQGQHRRAVQANLLWQGPQVHHHRPHAPYHLPLQGGACLD